MAKEHKEAKEPEQELSQEASGIVVSKNTLIAVVLGILVVVSLVQAFQLTNLKGDLTGGAATTIQTASASNPPQSAGGAGAAALPSSLQNLPSMVGGC